MFRRFMVWFLLFFRIDVRGIFRYFDGKRYRWGDPMEIASRLWEFNHIHQSSPTKPSEVVPFESWRCKKLIETGDGQSMARGYYEAALAAQEAFGVVPLSEGGLTQLECMDLIERFEAYLGDVKKNGKKTPTSTTSTDSTDQSPTNADSGSGSTANANSYEMPDVTGLV